MARTKIVTDSACDLSPEMAARYDISVVPLTIRFGSDEYTDRVDLTPAKFWELCAASPTLPETAAPSPGAFTAAFTEAADAGYDGIVCICLSAALSATYQSALAGASALADRLPIEVVDSEAVTMAQGLLAVKAAELAAGGADAASIAAAVRETIPRCHVMGVLDTLDHLVKGGRVGGAKALMGSLLSIKPILQLKDGVVAEESKQRTRARALRYLADRVVADAPFEYVAVVSGAAPDCDDLVKAITATDLGAEVEVADLGPVVGTHGGPRLLGVAYITTASA